MSLKVAILFDNFGPYHLARLKAASQLCDLLAIQFRQRSCDYDWQPSIEPVPFQHRTLDQQLARACPRPIHWVCQLIRLLGQFSPECVFIPGWSHPLTLVALGWCRTHKIPAVLMSESTEQDSLRAPWKEWLKARLVGRCAAALVGGNRQLKYLTKLGMPNHRIFLGYNVVDNDYFGRTARALRSHDAETRNRFGLPPRYFLASARFIARKNLAFLLRAYARYRAASAGSVAGEQNTSATAPWSLVLLGDGPERAALQRLILELRLVGVVSLPGFKQYAELPAYYSLAGTFVHTSTSEPWGLVINEAMASGLPVLVSNCCGCAVELVREGKNGFTFDPGDAEQLAQLMLRLSSSETDRLGMGCASAERISSRGPVYFAQGLRSAAELAVR